MDAICSAVKPLWEQAGAGLIPIVLASWTSSAALKGVERCLAASAPRLQASDHEILLSKYAVQLKSLNSTLQPDAENTPKHTPFTAGQGLRTAWVALTNFKSSRQQNETLICGRVFESPASHVTVQKDLFDGPRQTEAEHITMNLMLKTMNQLLCNEDESSKQFTLVMNPLLVDVEDYLDSERKPVTTSLVFGMQLLVESFKSFRFCEGAVQGINCRTVALKFVQEVNGSLKDAIDNESKMTCKCRICAEMDLYGHMLSFQTQLRDYVGQTRFDLYYQTPWVAGQHMQKILSFATYFGLQLCDRYNYLAAVLHLYNLLVQLHVLGGEIPLFESLCSSLRDLVFLGSLPSRNYYSHFVRYLGGRLDMGNASGHQHQTSRLQMPKAASIGSEPTGRLLPRLVSRFYDIENRRYTIDAEKWADVYQAKKQNKATRQEKARIEHRVHSNSFAVSLLQLKDYAAPEFSGDFPLARINFFALHLICKRVLEKIASVGEYQLLRGAKSTPVEIGMQLVTSLLKKVDEEQKDSFRERFWLPKLRQLRTYKEAIVEVLQGAPPSL